MTHTAGKFAKSIAATIAIAGLGLVCAEPPIPTLEPMLRAVPDAAIAAAKLAEVLGGQPAPGAIALSPQANRHLVSDVSAHSPSTAAA